MWNSYKIEAWGAITSPSAEYLPAGWILMQNPADDKYNPSKWTKVHWHTVGSGIGYCMAIYDGETRASTLKKDLTGIYDHTDAAKGCSGFGHSIATRD
jgi:hypothetical protein